MTRLGKSVVALTVAFMVLFIVSATWFNTDHNDHTKNGLFNVKTVTYGQLADVMWGVTWIVCILAILMFIWAVARFIQRRRTTRTT